MKKEFFKLKEKVRFLDGNFINTDINLEKIETFGELVNLKTENKDNVIIEFWTNKDNLIKI
jgi:hypothetical protein